MIQEFTGIAFIVIGTMCMIRMICLLVAPTSEKKEQPEEQQSDTKTRLTVKSIIRWEQLNDKPFSRLDYNSEDDIISLFYVCRIADEVNCSLIEFKEKLSEKLISLMIKDFERETSLMAQFQKKIGKTISKESDDTDTDPIYIKNLVPILIMNGLDAHFAMNEMELCDLSLYLDAYDKKVKDKLESARLWTYILLSPHLTKKTKSPKDLYPFLWELENIKQETESEKQESREILKSSLKYGLN